MVANEAQGILDRFCRRILTRNNVVWYVVVANFWLCLRDVFLIGIKECVIEGTSIQMDAAIIS